MIKNNTSKLEPFDLEIERTFHKLRNLVGEKLSSRKQHSKMEDTLAPVCVVGARVAARAAEA